LGDATGCERSDPGIEHAMTASQNSRSGEFVIAHSRAVARWPGLSELLGIPVVYRGSVRDVSRGRAVLAWGRKPSALRAEAFAQRYRLPVTWIEDGFLRSVGLGYQDPPLSLVVDDRGIYYDATVPSRLEAMVTRPVSADEGARARALVAAWCDGRVSKYNHAREFNGALPQRFVLVVDQTFGDAAIRFGLAQESNFARMLEAALDAHPQCTVLLKVHPDVVAGRKRGHFDRLTPGQASRVVIVGADAHPPSLLQHADAVYVVTSQMGFEGLLWRKPVHTFGMPFYAGWGLTQDALPAPERRKPAALENLVHAALVEYPRYIDPETGKRCEVERVMEHLALQRRMRERFPATMYALKFSLWKKPIVRAFFQGSELRFVRDAAQVPDGATLAVWGVKKFDQSETGNSGAGAVDPLLEQGRVARSEGVVESTPPPHPLRGHPSSIEEGNAAVTASEACFDTRSALSNTNGYSAEKVFGHASQSNPPFALSRSPGERIEGPGRISVVRMEDGFLRSVGLGADLVRPLSWVLDRRGMYYDATCPSDLEHLLQTAHFDDALTGRARRLRERIVEHGLTKYNVGAARWRRPEHANRVILVPGQVETDASIRYGAPATRTNMGLLRAVRDANPNALVIYKQHPDVHSGLRVAGEGEHNAARWCDEVVVDIDMGSLLPVVDEVHVLTSLTGFEALLRGKRVATYGQPFYAGWGLTQDIVPPLRRTRRLTLDELVAGTLIEYPTYVSRTTARFTTPERALDELLAWRASAGTRFPWWRKLLRRVLQLRGN
jgi:capsular polysaccharide export protein